MSRPSGLTTADTDLALPHDGKFVRLWRRLHDKALMCEARTLYEDLRLASWAAGERTTVENAASVWLDPDPVVIAAMEAEGLIDEDHRIPEHAWIAWYGPAYARLEARRASGALGGQKAAEHRRSALAAAEQ
jgi:hypothetical protein